MLTAIETGECCIPRQQSVRTDEESENSRECPEDNSASEFRLTDLTHLERNALENELALAARIQQALLPSQNFSRAGWEVRYHYAPAGILSGDYCDLFETRNGFSFLLGDVSGKGVAASILMGQLHATFRSLAEDESPLDAMVEAANRVFSRWEVASQFATLVAGRVEQNGTVQFVSAGHPPFLHLTKGKVYSKTATAIPLGMFSTGRFPMHRFSIGVGETLLAFTDGLTESRDRYGEEYGLQRLKALAARNATATPDELILECLSDQMAFTGGSRRSDDLSLLVIRRVS